MTRSVYRFGVGVTDGRASMKDLLGGKGANLAEMAAAGLPVPPGFTLSTEVCEAVLARADALDALWPEVESALAEVEAVLGLRFGDPTAPLLVSVRSGAAISMPGMMDTVLNLGINDAVAAGLAARSGKDRFAWDAYRRFVEMFGNVVRGVARARFESILEAHRHRGGVGDDRALPTEALRQVVAEYKTLVREATGEAFPEDPRVQLREAVRAVFQSWHSERAKKYREVQKIRGLKGTAVNVQAMVYGNMGPTSGTGVCFTRDPATGAKVLYGEYLPDAQGEDVVAGTRTPHPISALAREMPEAHATLVQLAAQLEQHFRNVQDIEFTVQDGRFFLLQTRHGKRTGAAAVRIAVDLVHEGLVTREEAVRNLVEPAHIDQLLHPAFADERRYRQEGRVLTKGLNASPGAAVGRVVFTAEDAEAWAARGEAVVLVRAETSPEDVAGMHAARGILTTRGGMTSHAAVVARGWGKPCVAGCGELSVDYAAKTVASPTRTLREGDWVSLNGTTGEVIVGRELLTDALVGEEFKTFMQWVDELRGLRVRANADSPRDAATARSHGAEGIGLCRTEHMFFDEDRIRIMREMILAGDEAGRRAALARLLPLQRADFTGIFRAMAGLPVTIRLLDPPLHEFLPHERAQQEELARTMGVDEAVLRRRIAALAESNPMLGHRGCRLGISHPEITEMQSRAIFEAACAVAREEVTVRPEVMVPLVGSVAEFDHQAAVVRRVADEVFAAQGLRIDYLVGTMIEVPRAALTAERIAGSAEFFSFGTNDLTQMALGISRDDVSGFFPHYLAAGIFQDDPFQTLDVEGVGQLVATAVSRGRSARAGLKLGICGEHGGDPRSIAFFARVGLDYVSCSPPRVPVARLAAAQAALAARGIAEKQGEA